MSLYTIQLPSGATVKHDSHKRYQVVRETVDGPERVTARDDLSPAVNAYYAAKLKLEQKQPDTQLWRLWLIDAETGAVVRPFEVAS